MDGRLSWLGIIALALTCAGCVTPQNQKPGTVTGPSAASEVSPEELANARLKREEGPKRDPKPSTEVKIGEVKESEAESEIARTHPEMQARFRDEARLAYQHALKLDPNFVEAYCHLGMLYAKMGDFPRALETLNIALKKHPHDAAVWYEMGLCHKRRQDFAESIRCYYKALEFAPEHREYMKTLGFTLAWTGQVEQGLAWLKRAQGAAVAHYNIAQVLLARDRADDAQRYLQQALRENPRYEQARDLLESLASRATAAAPRNGVPVN